MISRLSSSYTSWITSNLRWVPTSEKELEVSETKIFSFLKNKFKTYYVDVREQDENEKKKRRCHREEERKIWTIEMEDPKVNKPPIVLLHGFAAGIAFWTLNLDSLSKVRHVYAIDLLGFGRSTRPDLSKKEHPEDDIVDSIEIWRKNVGINKPFILLGHSFGSYIAASYAIKYGENLDRLILADPWGFSEHTANNERFKKAPTWVKMVFKVSMLFNPLAILRVSGPYGPRLMSVRDDLRRKFIPLMGDESREILTYAYHCNANKPSGEAVFKQLLGEFANPARPMIFRANEINKNIKINFLYAAESWLLREEEENLRKEMPDHKIDYQILKNAGHHLYSDNADGFNDYINNLEEKDNNNS